MELLSRVSTTAPTVMSALLRAALGKLVSRQASAKFDQWRGCGRPKRVPPSWSVVLSAVTTAKYSGMAMVMASTMSSAVSHQLTASGAGRDRRRQALREGPWSAITSGKEPVSIADVDIRPTPPGGG